MQQGSNGSGATATATLTDEQILGLEPAPATGTSGAAAVAQGAPTHSVGGPEDSAEALGSDRHESPRGPVPDDGTGAPSYSTTGAHGDAAAPVEPAWLKSLESSAIPNGGEAAAEARRWREAALSSAALDRDYFSAEPGARAGLAARLHQTDPAAFRSMLADAARILAERDPQALSELARELGGSPTVPAASRSLLHAVRSPSSVIPREARNPSDLSTSTPERDSSGNAGPRNDGVMSPGARGFPADAYREFAAATNNDVERQVRDSIERTLASTLPDGIADGARRRIGDDIFRDLNAALSSDRALSAQINAALRGPSGEGWAFDAVSRQQIASLLAGRARTALPEVARRVVSEWTSSVLASDRAKQARIESAASRRDITGGRLPESIASSALNPRRVDYGRTSDEQILEM